MIKANQSVYNTIYLLTNKLIITNMNGKFSTLVAGLLLASAFTANAGIVKVTTPVSGKSYVVGQDGTLQSGAFSGAVFALGSDGTNVTVSTIADKTATLSGLTAWKFEETDGNYKLIHNNTPFPCGVILLSTLSLSNRRS